ncbi:uncharacterized protein BO95DRAFT_255313 [Aspergillus brunneoviolaceus CBS 621.78]|uniref:Uncharacterized protein n=1 Tax=Aspergillus brunneoviolaceus CBS 621.78 TaxID=1450534 RepID=A0ACD1FY38_9EURO|nr:hypothetical protein BO95DRAFT_255313 [Aspergillus brunneoviolaceus CBS 621.78]RAH41938.1 hypothetical protein BO95DRAFT_255313 [Aspergillus brunneoviolaceus CBS 621.78]
MAFRGETRVSVRYRLWVGRCTFILFASFFLEILPMYFSPFFRFHPLSQLIFP